VDVEIVLDQYDGLGSCEVAGSAKIISRRESNPAVMGRSVTLRGASLRAVQTIMKMLAVAVALVLVIEAGPGVPASYGIGRRVSERNCLRSRQAHQRSNRDRVAACRPPAHLPWRRRTRHWPRRDAQPAGDGLEECFFRHAHRRVAGAIDNMQSRPFLHSRKVKRVAPLGWLEQASATVWLLSRRKNPCNRPGCRPLAAASTQTSKLLHQLLGHCVNHRALGLQRP